MSSLERSTHGRQGIYNNCLASSNQSSTLPPPPQGWSNVPGILQPGEVGDTSPCNQLQRSGTQGVDCLDHLISVSLTLTGSSNDARSLQTEVFHSLCHLRTLNWRSDTHAQWVFFETGSTQLFLFPQDNQMHVASECESSSYIHS